jgi:hypothetical protein
MANFRFVADLFDRAGAWQRVADARELANVWAAWLDAPALALQMGRRAADLAKSQKGVATAKTLERLRPFLGLDDLSTTPSVSISGLRKVTEQSGESCISINTRKA